MTLPELDGRRVQSRPPRRAALLRSLRGLIIRVQRYGRSHPDEQDWAATLLVDLLAALRAADPPAKGRR